MLYKQNLQCIHFLLEGFLQLEGPVLALVAQSSNRLLNKNHHSSKPKNEQEVSNSSHFSFHKVNGTLK